MQKESDRRLSAFPVLDSTPPPYHSSAAGAKRFFSSSSSSGIALADSASTSKDGSGGEVRHLKEFEFIVALGVGGCYPVP